MTDHKPITSRRDVIAGAGFFAGIAVAGPALPALVAAPNEAEILGWEAERARLWGLAEAETDEDEVARLMRASDQWEDKIRGATCSSLKVAIAKIAIARKDLDWGPRLTAEIPAEDVLDGVLAFLREQVRL